MGYRYRCRTLGAITLLVFGLALDAFAQSQGLLGEYYNNGNAAPPYPTPPGSPMGPQSTTATLVLTRIDAPIDFNWGTNSPGAGVNIDDFFVVWTGNVTSTVAGSYTFGTIADDGTRIWVNGILAANLVFNNWVDQGPPAAPQMGAAVTLAASTSYTIRVEFYENGGGAVARLFWQPPGAAAPVIIPSGNLTPPPPPPVPTNVNATATTDPQTGAATITVTWNPSAGATGYNVLRGANGAPPTQYATVTGGANTTYVDAQVTIGIPYCYVIQAVRGIQVSASSTPPACATAQPLPPRTNDHEEGFLDGGDCGCGSIGGAGLPGWLAGFLALALLPLCLRP